MKYPEGQGMNGAYRDTGKFFEMIMHSIDDGGLFWRNPSRP